METAVVLGPTGGIGKGVTDALIKRNITTKILIRDIEKYKKLYPNGNPPGEVNAVQGDLDNKQALAKVLEYADTIFLCFNTGYSNWRTDMIRWINRIADLATALQAKMVFPGNVYNFGRVDSNPINEETQQKAHTEKGQLRISMENRLFRAVDEGASLTILRFPDFYGPAVTNDLIFPVFKSALNNEKCRWYGDPSKLHDFIFTPDAGEAMVKAAMESGSKDAVLHVPGPSPITADEWIRKIYEIAGSDLEEPYNITPKWKLKLYGLINSEAAEFAELYYLFEEELLLDGTKYQEIIGEIPTKSHEENIKQALDWYRYWIDEIE